MGRAPLVAWERCTARETGGRPGRPCRYRCPPTGRYGILPPTPQTPIFCWPAASTARSSAAPMLAIPGASCTGNSARSTPSPGCLTRPTVCLYVTSLVVYSYGYDDGKIGPTRCALIGAALGDR